MHYILLIVLCFSSTLHRTHWLAECIFEQLFSEYTFHVQRLNLSLGNPRANEWAMEWQKETQRVRKEYAGNMKQFDETCVGLALSERSVVICKWNGSILCDWSIFCIASIQATPKNNNWRFTVIAFVFWLLIKMRFTQNLRHPSYYTEITIGKKSI